LALAFEVGETECHFPRPPGAVDGWEAFDGRDLSVKGISVFEIVVPDLINNIAKKFGNATSGRFETGIVIEAGFMGRLCTNPDDCCGVVGNVFIIEVEADGKYELGVAMFSFVLGVLRENGREGVDSFQLVVRIDHEEREKTLLDGKEIVIGWFPFKRGKGVCVFVSASG